MEVVKASDSSPEETLTRMVGQYQAPLFTMCYAYLHERELAKDAVQETFLRAYKALGTFRGNCSEKTWLTSIAINVCRSWRRGGWFAHVDRAVTPEELPIEACGDHDQNDPEELVAAIQKLPDKLKEVILLYYYQELTLAEISGIVGVTPSMVSRRIKKAHAKLYCALQRGRYDE